MTTLYLGGETRVHQATLSGLDGGELTLTTTASLDLGAMPSFLAFSHDGARVLVISEEDNRLSLLRRRPDGTLHLASQVSCPGGPAYVAFDRSETFALTGSYGSGESRVYRLEGDRIARDPVVLDTGKYTHCLVASPDNRTLFAPSKGTDTIACVAFDEKAGTMAPLEPASAPPGSGPRHLVFSLDRERAFVSGENDCSLLTYELGSRGLTLRDHQTSLPRPREEGDSGADIHMSESGRFVYVSNRGHDSISVFDVSSNEPRRVTTESTRGRVPRNFCLLSEWLIAANQESSTLAVFHTHSSTGALTFVGTVPTPERPFWVGNEASH